MSKPVRYDVGIYLADRKALYLNTAAHEAYVSGSAEGRTVDERIAQIAKTHGAPLYVYRLGSLVTVRYDA